MELYPTSKQLPGKAVPHDTKQHLWRQGPRELYPRQLLLLHGVAQKEQISKAGKGRERVAGWSFIPAVHHWLARPCRMAQNSIYGDKGLRSFIPGNCFCNTGCRKRDKPVKRARAEKGRGMELYPTSTPLAGKAVLHGTEQRL